MFPLFVYEAFLIFDSSNPFSLFIKDALSDPSRYFLIRPYNELKFDFLDTDFSIQILKFLKNYYLNHQLTNYWIFDFQIGTTIFSSFDYIASGYTKDEFFVYKKRSISENEHDYDTLMT
jgi:hypothetical protein